MKAKALDKSKILKSVKKGTILESIPLKFLQRYDYFGNLPKKTESIYTFCHWGQPQGQRKGNCKINGATIPVAPFILTEHDNRPHSTKSQENRVPFSISRFTFFPNNSGRYLGWSPKPGRTERTFCSVITSPTFISSAT